MGTRIAIPYAVKYPKQIQAIVLEDLHTLPAKKWILSQEKIDSYLKFKTEHTSIEKARIELQKADYSEQEIEKFEKDGRIYQSLNGDYVLGVHPYVKYITRNLISASPRTQQDFAKLNLNKTPTLLMRASNQSFVSDEGVTIMKEIQPKLKTVNIPNSKHSIHKSNPETFLKELNGFLSDLELE